MCTSSQVMGTAAFHVLMACVICSAQGTNAAGNTISDEVESNIYIFTMLFACSLFMAVVFVLSSKCLAGIWSCTFQVQHAHKFTQTSPPTSLTHDFSAVCGQPQVESTGIGRTMRERRGPHSFQHPIFFTNHGIAWHAAKECALKRTSGEIHSKKPCAFCVHSGHWGAAWSHGRACSSAQSSYCTSVQ